MKEKWETVIGYETYQVSNQGKVRKGSREIVPYTVTHGYLGVTLYQAGRETMALVHRLVAAAFVNQDRDDQIEVNHKNGDKQDNRAFNLEWVTHQENMEHARRTGLIATGANTNNAKLTEDQVIQIRELCSTGKYKLTELADMFGVTASAIGAITRWETWTHLGNPGLVILPPKRNHSKLTPDQVRQIRQVYKKSRIRMADLAAQFGVTTGQISNIINHKCWTDI